MNIGPDAVNLEEWLPYNVLRAESRALAGYRATAARAPATLVVSDEIGRPGQELMPGGNRAQYIRHWQRLYPRGLNVLDLPGGHYDMVRAPEALADIARAVRNCAGLEAQEQYPARPADQALPPGWNDEGSAGPRPESLGHIKRTWMDMRPASMHRGRC
jgi:uncharacterized protein YbdZ (MbtH family)